MFKTIAPALFAFDVEWIPDPVSAEILHGIESNPPFSLEESFQKLWHEGGATEKNPQPYLKTVLCRVLSISGVLREGAGSGELPKLRLVTLPRLEEASNTAKWTEAYLLEMFFKAVGPKKPQLVGYNTTNADLPILIQRAVVNGLSGYGFANRPDKPWEGVDYFSSGSEGHIDMATILGRYNQTPRLHEIATLSGIPGKMDVSGQNVWELWLSGNIAGIIRYNELDALTTYLVWARLAHFADLLDGAAYAREEEAVRQLIADECHSEKRSAADAQHLIRFREEWDRLKGVIRQRS